MASTSSADDSIGENASLITNLQQMDQPVMNVQRIRRVDVMNGKDSNM